MNMSRIFVTGCANGLGKMAAQLLIDQGHQVILHARNKVRAQEALAAVPGAEAVAVGDVATIAQTRDVAVGTPFTGPLACLIERELESVF
jgi:NAD(P)-dependent dehydrogenase (short-subunit alcohol dehydrogenase family)